MFTMPPPLQLASKPPVVAVGMPAAPAAPVAAGTCKIGAACAELSDTGADGAPVATGILLRLDLDAAGAVTADETGCCCCCCGGAGMLTASLAWSTAFDAGATDGAPKRLPAESNGPGWLVTVSELTPN